MTNDASNLPDRSKLTEQSDADIYTREEKATEGDKAKDSRGDSEAVERWEDEGGPARALASYLSALSLPANPDHAPDPSSWPQLSFWGLSPSPDSGPSQARTHVLASPSLVHSQPLSGWKGPHLPLEQGSGLGWSTEGLARICPISDTHLTNNRPSCKEFLSFSSIREASEITDSNFESKLAKLQPWMPGMEGKGFVDADTGQVHKWMTAMGSPIHDMAAVQLGVRNPIKYFVITEGGEIRPNHFAKRGPRESRRWVPFSGSHKNSWELMPDRDYWGDQWEMPEVGDEVDGAIVTEVDNLTTYLDDGRILPGDEVKRSGSHKHAFSGWEFKGLQKIAMPWNHYDEWEAPMAPPAEGHLPYYHVTGPHLRERILAEGLDPTKAMHGGGTRENYREMHGDEFNEWGTDDEYAQLDNKLWFHPELAGAHNMIANGWGNSDIWEANLHGLPLASEGDDWDARSAYHHIPPERLKLVHQHQSSWKLAMPKPVVWTRGLLGPEGQVHLWPEDEATHNQMLDALRVNYRDQPKWTHFTVADNTIGPYYLSDAEAEAIMKAKPQIQVRGYPRGAKVAKETPAQLKRRWDALGGLQHSEEIHRFPTGHSIVHLKTYGDVGRVGLAQVNCWQGRAGFSDPTRPITNPEDPYAMQYMSLHDPAGVPQASFYVHDGHISDVFAARNKPPSEENLQLVRQYGADRGLGWMDTDYEHQIYRGYEEGGKKTAALPQPGQKFILDDTQEEDGEQWTGPNHGHEVTYMKRDTQFPGTHYVQHPQHGTLWVTDKGLGLKPTYYHQAPTTERARIQQHGLQAADPSINNPDMGLTTREPYVHMTTHPDEVPMGAHFDDPSDIWEINWEGMPEPENDPDFQRGKLWPESIDPGRLNLHQPWEETPEIQKDPKLWPSLQERFDRGDAIQDAWDEVQYRLHHPEFAEGDVGKGVPVKLPLYQRRSTIDPVEDHYYHYAPTTERARIQQHGLVPGNPNISENWEGQMLDPQPPGVYLFRDLGGHKMFQQPMDLWRVPREQIAEMHRDPVMNKQPNIPGYDDLDVGVYYTPHEIPLPELHKRYEDTAQAQPFWDMTKHLRGQG